MKLRYTGLLLAGVLAAGLVEAAVVGGASVTYSEFDYQEIDASNGFKGFLGYRSDDRDFPLYFDLSYLDTGKADVTPFPGVTLNFSGILLSVGASVAVKPDSDVSLFIKGGLYDGDSEAVGPGGSLKESGSGFQLSIGLDWMWTPGFGGRVEYGTLFGVKDFVDDKDVSVLSAGIVFGGSGSERRTRTEPRSSPVVEPQAQPMSAPVAAPAPAPVVVLQPPPPPPQFVVGDRVQAKLGARLMNRPTAKADAIRGLGQGLRVDLIARNVNPAGAWWFCDANGAKGWVLEGELEASPLP